MNGIMDNYMVKRYPCRDYECLLAAEALPMIDELILKADLKKFLFYQYQLIKACFKHRINLLPSKSGN